MRINIEKVGTGLSTGIKPKAIKRDGVASDLVLIGINDDGAIYYHDR
jgi:hypothetical protein